METMLRAHRSTQDHWRRPRHHSRSVAHRRPEHRHQPVYNGYYDATNLQQAFESGGAFAGGVIEDSHGHFIRVGKPFDTTPVTFAVNNKRSARATMMLLMQDGQFARPHLDALWYQASIYKETGEGHLSLADDILAAIFVYALALRIESALWAKDGERLSLEQHRNAGRAG